MIEILLVASKQYHAPEWGQLHEAVMTANGTPRTSEEWKSKFWLLEVLSWVATVVVIPYGVFSWILEADDRAKERHYRAWELINSARDSPGDGGRLNALQDLNEDKVSLANAPLAKAYLIGIKLPNADLTEADLTEAKLQYADLSGADLSGAHLKGANLSNTNLSGANLAYVNLSEATLSETNLTGAKLCSTSLPDDIVSFRDCSWGTGTPPPEPPQFYPIPEPAPANPSETPPAPN